MPLSERLWVNYNLEFKKCSFYDALSTELYRMNRVYDKCPYNRCGPEAKFNVFIAYVQQDS